MSSQKGNVHRNRAQKHQNSTVFKNTKYDTSQRTKDIISVSQDGLCQRCKEKIEWKIKYKKYKPLSKPANCIRCHQKTVKKAYYTVCHPCAKLHEICAKCAHKKNIVEDFLPDAQTAAAEQSQMEHETKFLRERERRTLFRLQAQGKQLDGLNPKKTDDDEDEDDAESVDSATEDTDGVQTGHDDLCEGGVSDGEEKVDAYTLFE